MIRTGASFALVTLLVLGCRANDVGSPQGDLTGTFVLRSVAGATLPTLGNGEFMTAFTIIADTIRLYSHGEGVEVMVSQRDGEAARRATQTFTVTSPAVGRMDIDYGCNDTGALAGGAPSFASCIAPPHHRFLITARGLTIDGSALYRTPLVFERVDGAR